MRLIIRFVRRAYTCLSVLRKPAISDQYWPALLGSISRTVMMTTPNAAFDMADFVDFGEAGIPSVSQETVQDIPESPLAAR